MTRRLVVLSILIGLVAPWASVPDAGIAEADGRLTVLLIGGDAGPQRIGLRTDTMIVVTVDRETAQAALFGVPRNLVNVPLPEGPASAFSCRCWPDLLNALYAYGWERPDLFPGGDNPGATALMGAIGELLGLPVDHYALVDMAGFVEVIDVLGGVEIDVPEEVLVRLSPPKEGEGWQVYDIKPGRQHLDGREALAYARSREGGSDYDRMLRQRCLIGAIAKEADAGSLLRRYPKLAKVAKASVTTDIPLDALPDLIELADRVETDRVIAVGFGPPDYVASLRADNYPVPSVERMRAAVQAALAGSPEAGGLPLQTLPTTCRWTD